MESIKPEQDFGNDLLQNLNELEKLIQKQNERINKLRGIVDESTSISGLLIDKFE